MGFAYYCDGCRTWHGASCTGDRLTTLEADNARMREALEKLLSHIPVGVDGSMAPARIPLASQKQAYAALEAEGE